MSTELESTAGSIEASTQSPQPPTPKPVPWYRQWRTHFEILLFVFAAITFISSFYYRPNLKSSAGAVELLMPTRTQLDLMSFTLFFQPAKVQKAGQDKFFAELKNLGLAPDKINVLRKSAPKPDGVPRSFDIDPKGSNFTADENKLISLAAFRAYSGLTPEIVPPIASHAVFFTVKNEGRADAETVRVSVNSPGKILEMRSYSENALASSKTPNTCTFDAPNLSPGASISGIIWIHGEATALGSLSVSFKNGQVAKHEIKPSLFIESGP